MKQPDNQQKRVLAELFNSKMFEYLDLSRQELLETMVLANETIVMRNLQGRVMELTELMDVIKKSYTELIGGSDNKKGSESSGW